MPTKPRKSSKKALSRRNVAVLAGLLGSLVFTSIVLLILAPLPLAPDAVKSLFVPTIDQTIQELFQTEVNIEPNRWQYIYVHHSSSRAGNATAVGPTNSPTPDHFLIGNGHGCEDGELQIAQRWNLQQSARPPGARSIPSLARSADNCITICLVGDFDRTPPTDTQLLQLQNLVRALQNRLNIPATKVLAYNQPGDAGIGRLFPARQLAASLVK